MRRRLLAVAVTALLPSIAILAYNEFAGRQQRDAEVHQQVAQAAKQASSEVERVIDGIRSMLVATSAIPAVSDQDHETCGATLKRVAEKLPAIRSIAVLDVNGRLVCDSLQSPVGLDLSDRRYFREALQATDLVVGQYTVSRLSNLDILPIAMPLREDGKVTGVIATGVRIEWLQQRIEGRGLLPQGTVTIADDSGVIVARTPTPGSFVGTQVPSRYQAMLKAAASGTVEIDGEDGRSRIVGFEPISLPTAPFYVAASIDKDLAFTAINQATIYSLAVILLGAIAALTAATVIGNRFILAPISQIVTTLEAWRAGDASARIGLKGRHGELGLVATTVDALFDELDRRSKSAAALEETRALLNRELSHRVKNTLAIVQAIARQSFWRSDPLRYQAFSQRLSALSAAHDVLLAGDWRSGSMEAVVLSTLRPYFDESLKRLNLHGRPFWLPAKAILPMSLVLNELATNALKHGALSIETGRIDISWNVENGKLLFTWKESGGPAVSHPASAGFGTKLIERSFAAEFPAELDWDYAADGLTFTARIKVDEVDVLGVEQDGESMRQDLAIG